MEDMHTQDWTSELHVDVKWKCGVDNFTFGDVGGLEEHMRQSHNGVYAERQILSVAQRSSALTPRKRGLCLLCGCDPAQEQNSTEERPAHPEQSLPGSKAPLPEQFETGSIHSHTSDDLSRKDEDSEGTDSPSFGQTLILRAKLSRHIATHLQALSFMSLRLDTFNQPYKYSTGDANSESSEGKDESGSAAVSAERNSDLDDVSLTFDEDPHQAAFEEPSSGANAGPEYHASPEYHAGPELRIPSTRHNGIDEDYWSLEPHEGGSLDWYRIYEHRLAGGGHWAVSETAQYLPSLQDGFRQTQHAIRPLAETELASGGLSSKSSASSRGEAGLVSMEDTWEETDTQPTGYGISLELLGIGSGMTWEKEDSSHDLLPQEMLLAP